MLLLVLCLISLGQQLCRVLLNRWRHILRHVGLKPGRAATESVADTQACVASSASSVHHLAHQGYQLLTAADGAQASAPQQLLYPTTAFCLGPSSQAAPLLSY